MAIINRTSKILYTDIGGGTSENIFIFGEIMLIENTCFLNAKIQYPSLGDHLYGLSNVLPEGFRPPENIVLTGLRGTKSNELGTSLADLGDVTLSNSDWVNVQSNSTEQGYYCSLWIQTSYNI